MEPPKRKKTKSKILRSKDILGRVTGFSTPVFGLSWNPPESERKIISELFIYLEDRRALYYPEQLEVLKWVIDSILEIREELTKTIQRLPVGSNAVPHLKTMRAACRKFLDLTQSHKKYIIRYDSRNPGTAEFFTYLGELRGTFGFQIAHLSVMYGIDLEGDIIKILPTLDEE